MRSDGRRGSDGQRHRSGMCIYFRPRLHHGAPQPVLGCDSRLRQSCRRAGDEAKQKDR